MIFLIFSFSGFLTFFYLYLITIQLILIYCFYLGKVKFYERRHWVRDMESQTRSRKLLLGD